MKTKYFFSALIGAGMLLTGCSDFLDEKPQGVIDDEKAFSSPDEMVIAAYSQLGNCWWGYPFNLWPYGDVSSDDALKGGSGTTDTNYHPVEIWSAITPNNVNHMDELWYNLYCNISRCNRALMSLDQYGDAKLGAATKAQRVAEIKFLRGHSYFKLLNMWGQIPWIDEVVAANNAQEQTRNDEFTYEQLWDKVIADFKEAYDVLPATQADGGRTNKIAAASYLAKCYLTMAYGNGYEATNGVSHINNAYMQEVEKYTKVVADSHYDYLEDFGDIFLPENKNSKESIFAVQTSDYKEDNTVYGKANWNVVLNGCWGMWSCGWDFHKPSQDLVDAFKTENGLPVNVDNNPSQPKYYDNPAFPVNGVASTQKWDPRLFHTVGMPSFPYKYENAYMMTKDNSRTPNTYGYYTSLKEVPQRSKGETFDNPWQAFATADYVFRYTDVMLMRAEALVELGQLADAMQIVNDIRQRAKNSVAKHISYAANYCDIALYSNSDFNTKEKARARVRTERRLEMAMENGRYFDLKRWGVASTTLNAYFERAKNYVYDGQTYAQYYDDAYYTAGKHEFYPIPYAQMFYVPGLYVQNKNY